MVPRSAARRFVVEELPTSSAVMCVNVAISPIQRNRRRRNRLSNDAKLCVCTYRLINATTLQINYSSIRDDTAIIKQDRPLHYPTKYIARCSSGDVRSPDRSSPTGRSRIYFYSRSKIRCDISVNACQMFAGRPRHAAL